MFSADYRGFTQAGLPASGPCERRVNLPAEARAGGLRVMKCWSPAG